MDLKQYFEEFDAWVKSDPKLAARSLGTFPSIVKRWVAGTHSPSRDMVQKYHDEIKGKPIPEPQPPAPRLRKREEPSTQPEAVATAPMPAQSEEPEPIGGLPIPKASTKENIQKLPWETVEKMRSVFFPWEGKQITIALPCYKWTNAATAWTLVAIALDLGKEKVGFDMELGDAMIYHARNKLADRFVKSGREWLLFIDDDVIVPIGRPPWTRYMGRLPVDFPTKVLEQHVVHRLLSHNKTLVGGTYFGRQPGGMPMCSEMHNPVVVGEARSMKDGLRSMDWVATGCMLIHRSVFLDIQKKFPELGPEEDGRDEWDYFRPSISGGEDKDFCARARAAGHEVFLDTGLQCLHVGFACYGAHNTATM
jgi:hypothetical protein